MTTPTKLEEALDRYEQEAEAVGYAQGRYGTAQRDAARAAVLAVVREAVDLDSFWALHPWPEFADQPVVAVRAFQNRAARALVQSTKKTE